MTYQEMLNYISRARNGESLLYDTLVNAIRTLGDFDSTEQKIRENSFNSSYSRYRKSLSNVLYACDIYLGDKVHKTPYDDREKLDFAKKVKDTLQPLYNAALTRENDQLNMQPGSVDPASMSDDELRIMGRLQKNIGGSRIVARKSQISAKQSKAYSFFRNVTHKLFTGIKAIGLAVSSVFYVMAAPFTANREKYIKQLDLTKPADTEHIPGTKNETFDSGRVSVGVEQGADDQPILSDTRRAPFVFEKPIPEDPDQPPTFALRFKQSKLGSSIGLSETGDPGHAFVSMKYSKINPLTGKMQRYESVFGFYPRQGYGGGNAVLAQADEGLVVPAKISDDSNHPYSIEKVFTVDNKTINKVALAAHKYETEGYNMLSRNCASFANDMAKTAGIETSMFMQKIDLRSFFLPVTNIGLVLAGTMFSDIAEYDMLTDGVRPDYNYNNFGNRILNPQIVQKLSKTEFNFRTEGYVPSQIAEVIRSDDTVLLSENEYDRRKKTTEDLFALLEGDIEKMHLKLDAYADKHKLPELKDNNQRLCDFMKTRFRLLSNESRPALNNYYTVDNVTFVMKYKDQKAACKQLTGTINEYINDLSEIYRDTYKNDPDLNLLFNGYASKLNALKNVVKERYLKLRENLEYPQGGSENTDFYEKEYFNLRTREDYAEEIDITRDDAPALKDFYFRRLQYKIQFTDKDGQPQAVNCPLTPAECIGRLKIFGSMDKVVRDLYLSSRDLNSLSSAEKKELIEYAGMRVSVGAFIKSAESFAERATATKEDIALAFSELPELEDPFMNGTNSCVRYVGKDSNKPSVFCQGIIFGKTLQGLRERLNSISPQDCAANGTIVAETVGSFLAEKIADNTFGDIIDVLTEKEKKEYIFDRRTESKETYERNLRFRVCNALQSSLFTSYVNPLLEEVKTDLLSTIRRDPVLTGQVRNAFTNATDGLWEGCSKEFNGLLKRKFGVDTELLKKKTECKEKMEEALHNLYELKEASADTREALQALKKCTARMLAVNELVHTSGKMSADVSDEMIDQKADFYKKSAALNSDTVGSIAAILHAEPGNPDNMVSAAEIGLVNTFKAYEAAKNKGSAAAGKNNDKIQGFFNALKEKKDEDKNPNRESKEEMQGKTNEQRRQIINVINNN